MMRCCSLPMSVLPAIPHSLLRMILVQQVTNSPTAACAAAWRNVCALRNILAGSVAVELATVLVQTQTSGIPQLGSLAK